MEHVGRFASIMAEPDPPVDLALALVAGTGRPQVDPAEVLVRLDEIAADLGEVDDGAAVCAALFGPGGFVGDQVDYYDPRNSLIDQVLERRLGIPITLAVVAIEVGRRRGVELVGVGMPGHFLIGEQDPTGAVGPVTRPGVIAAGRWFDVFDHGRELDEEGCARVFTRLHGPTLPFERSMLAPVGPHTMVVRVLNNLLGTRTRRRDRSGVADVLALRAATAPGDPALRRQLAAALAAAGRFDEAASIHDELISLDPEAGADHRRAADALRARLN